jgi:hypothetical protein
MKELPGRRKRGRFESSSKPPGSRPFFYSGQSIAEHCPSDGHQHANGQLVSGVAEGQNASLDRLSGDTACGYSRHNLKKELFAEQEGM